LVVFGFGRAANGLEESAAAELRFVFGLEVDIGMGLIL
jgi:hypothetical protein